MNLRRLALWTVLALIAAAGGTGIYLWKQSRGGEAGFDGKAAALPIDPSQVAVARRANSLVVRVNIFPYVPLLEGKSRAEAKAILTETAREIGARCLSEEKYGGVPTASVTFRSLTSKNEYGDEDMRSTRRYGTVRLRRAEAEGVEVLSAKVAIDPAKEMVVYEKADPYMKVVRPALAKINNPPPAVKPGVPQAGPKGGEPLAAAAPAPKETSEQVLFDEVDLYDHPRYLGDCYPPFSPERVRRSGCDYFLAHDADGAAPGSAGPRFGEVVLHGEAGSVLYLPRAVEYAGAHALSFSYRKTDPKARCVVGLYVAHDRLATLAEGEHEAFPVKTEPGWHRVTIPLSAFTLQPAGPAPDSPAAPAMTYLRFHQVGKGELFGLELGLRGAAKGAALHFDRVALVRPEAPSRLLRGKVEPAVAGLAVEVNTPAGRLTAQTDSDGAFRVELPPDAKRYEVVTRHDGMEYLPAQGRYFDAGTCLAPLRIVLKDERTDAFPVRLRTIDYKWKDDGSGVSYLPRTHLLDTQTIPTKPQEFFTENSTNAFGYFDRDRRKDNPARALRVVVMGECYLEGAQVDSQERVASQMEAICRFAGGRPVEVIAVVNPKMAFVANWSAMKHVAFGLKPDLILVNTVSPEHLRSMYQEWESWNWGFHPNHPFSCFFELDRKTGKLREVPYESDWTLYLDRIPKRKDREYYVRYGGVNWERDIYLVDPERRPPFLKDTVKLLAAILKMFNEEGSKHGARVAVLNTSYFPERKWTEGGAAYDLQGYHRILEDAARKAGTFVVDGSKVLRRKTRPRAGGGHVHMWQHYSHWTPAAHRWIAEGVVGELTALGLVGEGGQRVSRRD